jgi:AraC-like DNA-binding protein
MRSRLRSIENWAALAKASRYRSTDLAQRCGVSTRQLERYSKAVFGASPHQWMQVLRLQGVVALIQRGTILRDIAKEAGYADVAHLSHDFKGYFGVCPSRFRENPRPLRHKLKRSRTNNQRFNQPAAGM